MRPGTAIQKIVISLLTLTPLIGANKPSVSPREIEIVATDYAFSAPAELAPGPIALRFNNVGKVRHEFNVSLLKKGVTADEFVAALLSPDKKPSTLIEGPVGVLFAKKNSRSSATLETNLQPDRDYMIICIFRDSVGAKRHYEMGMYSRIHVTAGKERKAASPTDTIVGMDYAFRYKKTTRPGMHSFMFVNKGKQRHEASIALLKAGITVDSLYKADKAGVKVNSLFDESPGLLHTPAGTTAFGLLRLNLLAGREYLIECGFQDSATAPHHYELGMYGSIKVATK